MKLNELMPSVPRKARKRVGPFDDGFISYTYSSVFRI